MTKRIISLFLALVTLLGILTIPAGAASSLEEAMKEVNVYARNKDLNWLTVNGSIKTQHYTYYNFKSEITGETKEIPAYCVNPTDYGVPALVPEGASIEYECDRIVSDPKVAGIVANGYPHTELYTLKLDNAEQAYYATKTALWCYLLSSWSVDKLGINPNLSGAEKETAQKVLEATKWIYMRGMAWTSIPPLPRTGTPPIP